MVRENRHCLWTYPVDERLDRVGFVEFGLDAVAHEQNRNELLHVRVLVVPSVWILSDLPLRLEVVLDFVALIFVLIIDFVQLRLTSFQVPDLEVERPHASWHHLLTLVFVQHRHSSDSLAHLMTVHLLIETPYWR